MPPHTKSVAVIIVALTMALTASAQGSPSPASPGYMKVCSEKNPPPCATSPHPTSSPSPEYSEEARQAKFEGTVVLGAVIGVDGRAHDINILRPLGHGLDEKAIETLQKWKFKPGKSGGAPVPVVITVEMQFHLFK